MKSTKQILLDAADLLRSEGWCQHENKVGTAHCIYGAVIAVQSQDWEWADPDVAGALIEAVGGQISTWNDTPGRTAEEVIAKLREVADSLD